jgi:hypothetical protein
VSATSSVAALLVLTLVAARAAFSADIHDAAKTGDVAVINRLVVADPTVANAKDSRIPPLVCARIARHLFRPWNYRAHSNHRYVVETGTRDLMAGDRLFHRGLWPYRCRHVYAMTIRAAATTCVTALKSSGRNK